MNAYCTPAEAQTYIESMYANRPIWHYGAECYVVEVFTPSDNGKAKVTLRPTGRVSLAPNTVNVNVPMRFRSSGSLVATDPITGIAIRFIDSVTAPLALAADAFERVTRSLPLKKEKPVKIRNKYYVAAGHMTSADEQAQDNTSKNVALSVPRVNPPHTAGPAAHHPGKWSRHDLADAIKHAEQILEAQPSRNEVAIVKIIRVVRRRKMPVVVEVIK